MSNFSCYKNGELLMTDLRYYQSTLEPGTIVGETLWDLNDFRKTLRNQPDYDNALAFKGHLIRSRIITKRVFISHRQIDKNIAIDIANTLSLHNINYWLDVLDPQLSGNQSQNATAIANIIEMALLNCTHVLAVMTDNSLGSNWIPYEYGRVKEKRLMVSNVCAYTFQLSKMLPEYMLLGEVVDDDKGLLGWV